MEQWKVIPEFPDYEVSDRWFTRRRKTQKRLQAKDNGRGYFQICMYRDGRRYWVGVHKYAQILWPYEHEEYFEDPEDFDVDEDEEDEEWGD